MGFHWWEWRVLWDLRGVMRDCAGTREQNKTGNLYWWPSVTGSPMENCHTKRTMRKHPGTVFLATSFSFPPVSVLEVSLSLLMGILLCHIYTLKCIREDTQSYVSGHTTGFGLCQAAVYLCWSTEQWWLTLAWGQKGVIPDKAGMKERSILLVSHNHRVEGICVRTWEYTIQLCSTVSVTFRGGMSAVESISASDY